MIVPEGIDPWDLIKQRVPAAIDELSLINLDGILPLLEARFREGDRQYRGDWMTRPPAWFDAERAQEVADAVIYGAMRMVIEDSGS